MELLLICTIALQLVVLLFLVIVLRRRVAINLTPIEQSCAAVEKSYERTERAVRDEFAQNRKEFATSAGQLRSELASRLKEVSDSLNQRLTALVESNERKLDSMREQTAKLTQSNEQKLEAVRTTVEAQLGKVREDNQRSLEAMRTTVDKELHATLDQRLGDSFKLVNDRLEQVHKGLGEMQSLATGVGDLKRVLTNVKTRGIFGEAQLSAILEQVLAPDRYATNVDTTGTGERVEFAIRLPGRGDDPTQPVWLPIDAKFPDAEYQRLLAAQEQADPVAVEEAAGRLENWIKVCARAIYDKYIGPPRTTDFGILFLPTESLFAEVLRRPDLAQTVQRDSHVVIAGPTTLWSIVNSLQMGFRTLAIQKRSGEVWELLAAVKTEWSKYGDVLFKLQKKLQEASSTVDDATRRTRVIGRRLQQVEELPTAKADALLAPDDAGTEAGGDGPFELQA